MLFAKRFSFFFLPSYRKIVSEYEKTIAQMIGRCFCSDRCYLPLWFSEESLETWLKPVGFLWMLATSADAAGDCGCRGGGGVCRQAVRRGWSFASRAAAPGQPR